VAGHSISVVGGGRDFEDKQRHSNEFTITSHRMDKTTLMRRTGVYSDLHRDSTAKRQAQNLRRKYERCTKTDELLLREDLKGGSRQGRTM